MQTELQLKHAVDDVTAAVVRAVHDATSVLGHRAMLVGATARIILLEHVFGLQGGRATRDVDFAFAIDTWEQFDTLKQCLLGQHGFTVDSRIVHKLYYQPDGVGYHIAVDIVPFGALSGVDEELRWPPEMAIVMNVAGFADALASAVNVAITPGITMPIASLPAMAVLKLFAWLDRRRDTPKDAIDLAALLQLYFEIDQERVFTVSAAILERAGYDIELAGGWLLGSDARHMASQATAQKVTALLADAALGAGLARDMSRALRTKPDPLHHATQLLAQFKEGFGQG